MGEAIKRVLVAGGSGFVGSYLLDMLQTAGYETYNFDRKNDSKHDALDLRLLENYAERNGAFDLIVNLIRYQDLKGKGGRDTGFENPLQCIYENCTTALNLCELAKNKKIEKMIYVSSCAVYGTNSEILTEETRNDPSDPYAASKIAAENIIEVYSKSLGQFRSIILRPTIIVGENQGQQRNILQDLIDCAYNGRKLPVYEDSLHKKGAHMREFVHPIDISQGILKSIDYFYSMEGSIDSFILGSRTNRITINELASRIIKVAGGRSTIQYCKVDKVFNQISSSAKAQHLLKWKAEISVNKIIEKIVYEKNKTKPNKNFATDFKPNPLSDE